jgi:hypothetical protein
MPSFAWQLNDDQIAASPIRNGWGAAAPAVSNTEVGKERSNLAVRTN